MRVTLAIKGLKTFFQLAASKKSETFILACSVKKNIKSCVSNIYAPDNTIKHLPYKTLKNLFTDKF